MDDVICFGRTLVEHNDRLRAVLVRFREHNLRVKLLLFVILLFVYIREISFCRNKNCVSRDVVSEKVEAVQNITAPTCIKELRSFLGLAGYYRRFIGNFATIAAPLPKLTTKEASKTPFNWSDECEKSFVDLKRQLCSAPLLAYPKFD